MAWYGLKKNLHTQNVDNPSMEACSDMSIAFAVYLKMG